MSGKNHEVGRNASPGWRERDVEGDHHRATKFYPLSTKKLTETAKWGHDRYEENERLQSKRDHRGREETMHDHHREIEITTSTSVFSLPFRVVRQLSRNPCNSCWTKNTARDGRERRKSRSRSRSRSRSGEHDRRENYKDKKLKKGRGRSRSVDGDRKEKRSVLTGKKIKMKVHMSEVDHERESKRQQLLEFLNSACD
ncbi:hypothetical protein SCHPADRAFT_893311 [Schizopora paradoxa]|uniref:Uncharacterized protein n=1 Tax=Schizopora paradoxa TaxID=27342 RepID=A0A0H2RCE7_9AGAM|nr:hypothetical protein SCHPADRAFT_893311 [Schizopora paradoxa]